MAFPFILGVAVGVGAVVAYNNSKKIKDKTNEVFEKSKDLASDVKKNVDATVECIKDKVDKKETEEKPKTTRKRTVRKKVTEEADDGSKK